MKSEKARNVATVLMVAMALTLGAKPVEHVNCLVNGDFEAAIKPDGTSVGWESLPKNFKIVKNAGENGSTGLVYENDDHKFYAFPMQKVKLVAGANYELSARVMIEKLESPKGACGGVTICVECLDAKHKYLPGIFSGPAEGKGKWVDLKVQGKVPEGTVTATFAPFVSHGLVGKVHFDSFRVERVISRPVYGVHSSAYRAEVAEGPIDFVAGLEFNGADIKPEDCEAVFFVPQVSGGERRMKPSIYDREQAKITLDAKELPMGKSKVRFELRRKTDGAVVEDGAAETEITRVAKLTERRVTFDRRKRVIVDGKPFFPLGMYWSEPVTTTNDELNIYADSAFNCVMNYGWLDEAALDAYHKKGLKVLYNLACGFGDGRTFSTVENANKWVAERVSRFKNHPALLAWYVNDERGLDFMPQLLARQEYLHREDPNHPTWAVMYQLPILKNYVETCDVIGTDPYPVGNSERLAQVAEWTEAAVNSVYGLHPVWMVPQAFDWGLCWKDKNDKTRYPELEELKNMYWQTIVCGANGLIAYNYTHLHEMDWKTPRAKTWANTAEASREIGRFVPVLLMGDEPAAISCDNRMVRARAYREGDVNYALVVNLERKANRVTVKIAGDFNDAREELGPKPKNTAPGAFEVEMPPIGVAMWKLGKKK